MYQVNKSFIKQILARQYKHKVPNVIQLKILYPLESRKLLKVSGNDAPLFLQGLVTNDMQHFEEGANSMYAMFLNNKGRVLYDTLIYKWEGNDSFLIECDRNVHTSLLKHLKLYKLRRNVDIGDVSEEFRLYTLVIPTEATVDTTLHPKKNVNIFKDPRLADLGHRVVVTSKADNSYIENLLGEGTTIASNEIGYKYLRHKLGVSEGADDLPPGVCFPLEANCDYLHGVSFHKGCYIGQELTARVHHTGVVRKRILPLQFSDIVEDDIEKDSEITVDNEKKSNVGKFKSCVNDYGLGLVRIKEALEATALKIGNYTLKAVKPDWWPKEAPKDKATTKLQ